jgi:hypothetical protein
MTHVILAEMWPPKHETIKPPLSTHTHTHTLLVSIAGVPSKTYVPITCDLKAMTI